MEEKISFESFLFGEGNEVFIDDIEFCIDRIVMLPKIRPQKLEKIVDLSAEYCKLVHFRRKLLEKSKKMSSFDISIVQERYFCFWRNRTIFE